MKKLLFILPFFLMISVSSFADTPTGSNKQSYTFLQGDSTLGGGFMTMLDGLPGIMQQNAPFTGDAQVLAAIFMIIFFAIKSYGMMTGEKQLEIMPLLRPFGLAMIILWWTPFTRMIALPTESIANTAYTQYSAQQNIVDNLRLTRADLMITIADSLYTFQAQTQTAASQSDNMVSQAWNSVSSAVKSGMAAIVNPIMELKNRMQIGMQLLLTQMLELLGIWILRMAVYIIFGLQIIYSTILYMLGPFAVAASILPAFRDSLMTWIARFISVNLYKGIAYIILWIMGMIQEFALQSEISKYQTLVKSTGSAADQARMVWFASSGILSFGEVIIAFVITAACMFTVPSISTWIISTSGISSAASNMGRGAHVVAGAAKKAAGVMM